MPDKKPDGSLLNEEDRQEAIDFCLSNIPKFLAECPYFNFENTLFDIRFSDKARSPKKSDAIDLEHVCCSIPYCDVVDKYLKHISGRANQSLKMAKIVSCIDEIRSSIL